jgi:uncharacterized protein (TIGR02271 family)
MTLHKIKEFDPDYAQHLDDRRLDGLVLCDEKNEKIGAVDDFLVDEHGKFRYFVIDAGGWLSDKKVLLPIGRSRIDYDNKRVYADNLTKDQLKSLPEYIDEMAVDDDYEEQVRGVYRTPIPAPTPPKMDMSNSMPVTTSAPMPPVEKDADLYDLNEENHPNMKLYEERLIASKTRQKTGEAVISKRVETETASASVAVDKERIVVERIPVDAGTVVTPTEANFQAGEVARMDVYAEVPEFHKEAFVREEVRVSKVVDHETATAEEKLRREELDVSNVDRPIDDSNV